jgi:hypothetical protein
MLIGVYAIPRTINVDSCKEADGKSVKTSTERKLLACRAKGEPLSIALLLNSPDLQGEQFFAAINKAIMNKWLLQAPQARCGMSHVAPWSLLVLVLLRSWKPWLKRTKYSRIKTFTNQNIALDVSTVDMYTCSEHIIAAWECGDATDLCDDERP